MADHDDVATVVKRICNDTLRYDNFGDDEDFFGRGASSLTVVDLQLKIEDALGIKVPTSDLMLDPTIAGWSRIYTTASTTSGVPQ